MGDSGSKLIINRPSLMDELRKKKAKEELER
jgi:hypothetical protein